MLSSVFIPFMLAQGDSCKREPLKWQNIAKDPPYEPEICNLEYESFDLHIFSSEAQVLATGTLFKPWE